LTYFSKAADGLLKIVSFYCYTGQIAEINVGTGTLFNNLIEIGNISCVACQKTGDEFSPASAFQWRGESPSQEAPYIPLMYELLNFKRASCFRAKTSQPQLVIAFSAHGNRQNKYIARHG